MKSASNPFRVYRRATTRQRRADTLGIILRGIAFACVVYVAIFLSIVAWRLFP